MYETRFERMRKAYPAASSGDESLSQEELAEKLNVSQNTIAKIECGLRRQEVVVM